MKRYLPIILFILALTGCSDKTKTFQYLIEHPEEIQPLLNSCSLQVEKATVEPQCIVANQAADHLRDLVLKFRQNPQKFGELILQTQMQIAKNKKSAELQAQYRQYMSVIRMQGI